MLLQPVMEATWQSGLTDGDHCRLPHLGIDPVEDVDPVAGHPPSLHTMAARVRALGTQDYKHCRFLILIGFEYSQSTLENTNYL